MSCYPMQRSLEFQLKIRRVEKEVKEYLNQNIPKYSLTDRLPMKDLADGIGEPTDLTAHALDHLLERGEIPEEGGFLINGKNPRPLKSLDLRVTLPQEIEGLNISPTERLPWEEPERSKISWQDFGTWPVMMSPPELSGKFVPVQRAGSWVRGPSLLEVYDEMASMESRRRKDRQEPIKFSFAQI